MRKNASRFVLLMVNFCLPSIGVYGQHLDQTIVPRQDCGLTLSGSVIDHETSTPLIGATVTLEGTTIAVNTDTDGHYHFHGMCPGTYTIAVSYIGYTPERSQKNLKTPVVADFKLHPDALQLRSVEVHGTRAPAQTTQASGQLSGQELAQTQGQSLALALERLNGLTSMQTGPSIAKPIIHGLHSNRILVMNNGVRHEAQQWGSEHAPEIDLFVASQLTVVKGAAGVRYGADAIGGVILVKPKPLRDSAGLGGEVNLVGVTNNRQGVISAMLEGNSAKMPALSWRLQGTLKKAGNSKTPNYYLANTGYTERNFSAAAGWQKGNYGFDAFFSQFQTRLGVFSASHVGNLTDIRNAIQRERPEPKAEFTYAIGRPYQNVTHDLLKLHGYWRTGELGKLHLTYSRQYNQREEYDNHGYGNSTAPGLRFEIITQNTEAVWEHKPVRHFSGSMGASYMYQFNRYEGRFFIPFYESHTGGIFWIERWQKDKLQLEAGLRYDVRELEARIFRRDTPAKTGQQEQDNVLLTPTHDYQNLSGTLGAIYDLSPHLNLSLSAATAWRSPTASELYSNGIHHGTGTYEYGDPTLGVERAYNFMATLIYSQNKRLNAEVSVYRNYINGYIYQEPDTMPTLTIRGAFLTTRQRQTDATLTGLDATVSYQLTDKLLFSSKASLVRGYNRSADEYLIWIPSDRYDNSLRYDMGSIGHSNRFSQSFLSVGGQVVLRQTHIPDNYLARDYARPPAGYFLLRAEAGTTFKVGKQVFEVGIIGRNLLNNAYRDYLNRFRYYSDEVGRSVTVRVKIPLNFSSKS